MRRDPRAVRFIDWWQRNRRRHPDAYWMDFIDEWMEPFGASATDLLELYEDAAVEYRQREYDDPTVGGNWVFTECDGMVITDFERIPDGMDEAA